MNPIRGENINKVLTNKFQVIGSDSNKVTVEI